MSIFSCCSKEKDAISPEIEKKASCIPKAIAIIVSLGGLFLLLASYEVLPSFPNFISNMGIGGRIGAIAIIGLGMIGLFCSCEEKKEFFPHLLSQPIEDTDFKYLVCFDKKYTSLGPKKLSDKTPVNFMDAFSKLKILSSNLKYIDMARKEQGIPGATREIKILLRLFIEIYDEKGEEARIDPSWIQKLKDLIQNLNEATRILNDKIDQITADFAGEIAKIYNNKDEIPDFLKQGISATLALEKQWRGKLGGN